MKLSMQCLLAAMVAIAWSGAGTAAAAPPPAAAPSTLKQQISAAEKELAEDEKELYEVKDVVTRKDENTPGKAPPGSTAGPKAVEVAPVPPAVRAQAVQECQWAQAKVAMAQQAIARAKAAPNDAVAQVELKDAILKAEEARDWKRRAESAFRPQAEPAAKPPPERTRGAGIRFASKTYDELVRHGQKTSGYDTAGRRDVQFADPVNYDSKAKVLTTAEGRTIPIAPLDNAFRQAVPAAKGVDLFVPVAKPGGGTAVRMNPEVVKQLSTPQAQTELHKVGGVALDVTIDLLGYAGVPDFRWRGASVVVEGPVLLSLGALWEKVRDFGGDGKPLDDMPQELRYPGNIERICGFVLDARGEDVLLIGVPAQKRENRIDLDCIVLALRTVWAEGSIPSVSLDPLPGRAAGPQHCRVYGVPYDSTPAKLMLEADYAMKRITIGQIDVGVPRFAELAKAHAMEKSYHGSRFWLTPIPLGAGEVRVSPTYRTVLFHSGVRALTEAMDAAEQFTGRTDELSEQVAGLFTEKYDLLERSAAIAPEGVFTRLHGLVDAVVAAKLLRDLGVACPVLEKLSRLPARRLAGAEAVPAFYPGIKVLHGSDDRTAYYLVGGAVLRARATRRSLDMFQDTTTAALERAADGAGRGVATRVEMSFSLPRGAGDGHSRADYAVMGARQALKSGRAEQAKGRLEQVVADDPQNAEAWGLLGVTLSLLGRHDEAGKAMLKAAELEPDDVMEMEADVARRAGRALGSAEAEGWKRRCLSEAHSRMATDLAAQGDANSGRAMADFAIKLWDENAGAYFARSDCWGEATSEESVRDRTRAIELYRKLLKAEHGQKHLRALAFVLSQDVGPRLALLEQKTVAAADERGNLVPGEKMDAVLKDLEAIVGESAEARKLDESLGLTWVMEAEAKAFKARLMSRLGSPGDASAARELALETVKKFPNLPDAHFALAFVDTIHGILLVKTPQGRYELGKLNLRKESFDALARAVELDPTYSVAYVLRATMYASGDSRDKALRDLRKAKEIDPKVNPAMEQAIRKALGIGPDEKLPEPADEPADAGAKPVGPPAAGKPSAFQMRLVAKEATEDTERMTLTLKGRDPNEVRLEVLHVKKEVLVDASAVKSIRAVSTNYGPRIEIEFTEAGTKWVAEATGKNLNRRFAFILGGRVVMAPVVGSPLRMGAIDIYGARNDQEAKELVDAVNEVLKWRK